MPLTAYSQISFTDNSPSDLPLDSPPNRNAIAIGDTFDTWREFTNLIAIDLSDLSAAFNTVNNLAIVTEAGSATLTNKTIDLDSNTLTGTLAEFNTALQGDSFVSLTGSETLTNKILTSPTINNGTLSIGSGTLVVPNTASPAQTAEGSIVWDSDDDLLTIGDGTGRKTMADIDTAQTLTNKTIDFSNNTLTGTLAEFNTAVSDATLVSLAGSETLTNKTLTTPIISSISNSGTITIPTGTDTLVGRNTTDTLTNKTLTSPTINGPTIGGVFTLNASSFAGSAIYTSSYDSPDSPAAGFTDSDGLIPTNAAVKDYVDAQIIAAGSFAGFNISVGDSPPDQAVTSGATLDFSGSNSSLVFSNVGTNITATINLTNLDGTNGVLPNARLPDLVVADFAAAAIQVAAEGFVDSDTILMTAAAINDRIESFGYGSTAAGGLAISSNEYSLKNYSSFTDNTVLAWDDGNSQFIDTAISDNGSIVTISSALNLSSIVAGTDNTVLILSGNNVRTDEIDSRVWGSSLVDGSGTGGYISYWSDTNTIANSVLYQTGGSVGIGTITPAQKLEIFEGNIIINSSGAVDSRVIFSRADTDLGWIGIPNWDNDGLYIYGPNDGVTASEVVAKYSQDIFAFYTAGSERARINASGNVGIGTTTPSTKLHVSGEITGTIFNSSSGVYELENAGAGYLRHAIPGQTLSIGATTDTSPGTFYYAIDIVPSSDYLTFSNSSGEVVRIDSSSNVGIGTTTPTEMLEIAGNAILDATDANLKIKSGTTGTTGSILWTFDTDATEYASLRFAYDTRTTVGLEMYTQNGYDITINSGDAINFKVDDTLRGGFTGTGNFFVDTNTLYVNAGTASVGINDTTPSYNLDVNGTFRATGLSYFDSKVQFNTDLEVGTDVFFVDESLTRVGINDGTPDNTLDVNGTFRATGASSLSSTLTVTGATTLNSTVSIYNDLNVWSTNSPEASVLFVDSSATRVGINDITPSYDLDVNGTFRVVGHGLFDSGVTVTNDFNVNVDVLFVDADLARVGINEGAPSYSLDVDGTVRSTGAVTFDSTLTVTGVTTLEANVNHNVSGGGAFPALYGQTHGAILEDAGATGSTLFVSRTNNIAAYFGRSGTGDVVSFRNTADESSPGDVTDEAGSVEITGTNSCLFQTASDYRLKENEVDITDGIVRLKKLKPYTFNFKKEPNIRREGFFAHEVGEVIDNIVTVEKDAENEYGDPVYQKLDHSAMVPLLTAALKEAIAKIESLEKRISALES